MRRIIAGAVLAVCLPAAHAGIFKCTKADGKVAFQDQPCAANETSKTIATPSSQRESSDPLMAAAIVYGVNASLEQMQSWCGGVDPATQGPIDLARQDWRRKHAILLDKSSAILQARLSIDERIKLTAQMKQEGNAISRKLATADRSDQLQWCMNAPGTIASPQMDLSIRPILMKTLMSAR